MRAWVDRAACAGMDTGYWYPEDSGRQHSAILALRICRGCEVREECLTWAMEIGIQGRTGCSVMALVLTQAAIKRQSRVESQHQATDAVVEPGCCGQQHPMHGVMADDEQPRLQLAAQQHSQQQQRRRPAAPVGSKNQKQAEQPTAQDEGREQQPSTGGWPQRASLSSSAGEASRSIATK